MSQVPFVALVLLMSVSLLSRSDFLVCVMTYSFQS